MIKPLDFNKDPWPVKLAVLVVVLLAALAVVWLASPALVAAGGATGGVLAWIARRWGR